MPIMAWNVRGLGNKKNVRALHNSVFKVKPAIIFLSETKQKKRYLEKIKMKMKMEHSFYVEPQGLAGGLALWWTGEANISILRYDKNYIDTKIVLQEGEAWYSTFIYGPPYREDKQAFWEGLSEFRESTQDKWLIMGDSNTVLRQEEKERGNPVNPAKAKWFEDFVDTSGLVEMPIKGGNFTWFNQRSGEHSVLEKLDRILCSAEWSLAFPKAMEMMEVAIASVHAHIVLLTKGVPKKYMKDFKFETKWLLDEECSQTVSNGWNISPGERVISRFRRKIRNTKTAMVKWNREKMKVKNEKKQMLLRRLSHLQGRKLTELELDEFKELKK